LPKFLDPTLRHLCYTNYWKQDRQVFNIGKYFSFRNWSFGRGLELLSCRLRSVITGCKIFEIRQCVRNYGGIVGLKVLEVGQQGLGRIFRHGGVHVVTFWSSKKAFLPLDPYDGQFYGLRLGDGDWICWGLKCDFSGMGARGNFLWFMVNW